MSRIDGVSRNRLLSVLEQIEWHHQRANYEPECPSCIEFQSKGHHPACDLKQLITDIERSGSMPKKTRYLKIVTKVAIVVPVENVDMPTILDKYREDGAAEIQSAEVVELADDEVGKVLQEAVDEPQ